MRQTLLKVGVGALMIAGVGRLDRFFFKQNDSFSIRYVHSTLPSYSEWQTAPLSCEEREAIEGILAQEFTYFAKGGQCYAFASKDGGYVLKLIRFPSSLRPYPWLSHLFSRYGRYRIEENKRSLQKLYNAFESFLLAYRELREESGLVYLHLNPSEEIAQTVTLIDKTGMRYQLALGKVAFILQKRAELIYPTLDRYKAANDLEGARDAVAKLFTLILSCAKKGVVDYDAILRKNYGFTEERAIHIDLGAFARDPSIQEGELLREHLLEMTASFKKRLERSYPEFLFLYNEELARLCAPTPMP